MTPTNRKERQMNVNELTVGQVREISALVNPQKSSESWMQTGKSYLIRATFHHIGRVVRVTPTEIVLTGGGWLADSGRFSECLANGTVNEFEACPEGSERIVSRDDIIDAFEWHHDLPEVTI
jgi:hypothetical protein